MQIIISRVIIKMPKEKGERVKTKMNYYIDLKKVSKKIFYRKLATISFVKKILKEQDLREKEKELEEDFKDTQISVNIDGVLFEKE